MQISLEKHLEKRVPLQFFVRVHRVLANSNTKQTKNAVSAYQRAHGLKITGDADIKTWDLIKAEYEKHMKMANLTHAEIKE